MSPLAAGSRSSATPTSTTRVCGFCRSRSCRPKRHGNDIPESTIQSRLLMVSSRVSILSSRFALSSIETGHGEALAERLDFAADPLQGLFVVPVFQREDNPGGELVHVDLEHAAGGG